VRANDPEDKVRELQRRLWRCAKRSKTRRFHALYDRIYRGDVLWEAWRRVKANRGAAGVDQQTLADIEAGGVEQFLSSMQETLRAGEYRAQPVRRRYILKADGKQQRPLGIPTVRDRVVQMAAKLVVEPIFEADFLACSYGFRPKRSATQALEAIRQAGNRGHNFVVDADIRAYFDSIDQGKLMAMLKKRISDRRVLKLLRKWLEAGVMEDGRLRSALAGTPQGGVISPLLANIYLHELDRIWSTKCSKLGILVRYADDLVVMCRTQAAAKEAHRRLVLIMERLGLELHPEKTRLVELSAGKEQFEFLGCSIRKRRSVQRMPNRHFMQRWPSPKAMKRLRQRVHELTDVRCNRARDVKDVIASLNPVLRGWGNYFRTGNADREFNHIDTYVDERLRRWHWRGGGQRARPVSLAWSRDRHHGLGLYRLRGTVCYPVQAMPLRPSLSRVQGAACNGVDHAGESPVAAIARFGCVAMPDVDGGRPPMAQAQVKVLGAGKPVRPVRRASELRGRSESEHYNVETASHEERVVGYRAAEPISCKGEGQRTLAKATGHRSRCLLRRIGGGTEGLVSDPKQGRSRRREALYSSLWQGEG